MSLVISHELLENEQNEETSTGAQNGSQIVSSLRVPENEGGPGLRRYLGMMRVDSSCGGGESHCFLANDSSWN